MAEILCQRWLITGRVQGVGYRAWMVAEATTRGVDGWVRNLASGAVEAMVLGDSGALAQLHRACLGGPRGARVAEIMLSPADPGAVISDAGFQQIRDSA
jgi:acylphosphatase